MYPFKQAKVLLGLHVPQVGNACFRELHVELNYRFTESKEGKAICHEGMDIYKD